jgi:hypothetical protein
VELSDDAPSSRASMMRDYVRELRDYVRTIEAP